MSNDVVLLVARILLVALFSFPVSVCSPRPTASPAHGLLGLPAPTLDDLAHHRAEGARRPRLIVGFQTRYAAYAFAPSAWPRASRPHGFRRPGPVQQLLQEPRDGRWPPRALDFGSPRAFRRRPRVSFQTAISSRQRRAPARLFFASLSSLRLGLRPSHLSPDGGEENQANGVSAAVVSSPPLGGEVPPSASRGGEGERCRRPASPATLAASSYPLRPARPSGRVFRMIAGGFLTWLTRRRR